MAKRREEEEFGNDPVRPPCPLPRSCLAHLPKNAALHFLYQVKVHVTFFLLLLLRIMQKLRYLSLLALSLSLDREMNSGRTGDGNERKCTTKMTTERSVDVEVAPWQVVSRTVSVAVSHTARHHHQGRSTCGASNSKFQKFCEECMVCCTPLGGIHREFLLPRNSCPDTPR